jgi:hypothetical protein
VKILFDANTPAPLARFLRGHDVILADELGWQGMENGALLDAAENAGFDLLLTCDQNIRYQQSFTSRKTGPSYLVLESLADSAASGSPNRHGGRLHANRPDR